MGQLIPEKYISIEYKDWIDKYKPLEEENERLKRELEESKIKVRISINTARAMGLEDSVIGYVTATADKGFNVKIDKWDEVRWEIERQFTDSNNWRSRYLSHDELKEFMAKNTKLLQDTEKEVKKIKSLPRIIRWIFKIKTNLSQ